MSDNIDSKDCRAYRFAEFRLDLTDETLWRNGERLNINRRMFQVLLLLIENKNRVVAKEVFFQEVWKGNFVEDNNLTVTIAALRRILNEPAKQAKFIENLPRRGYRFTAPVEIEQVLTEGQPVVAGEPTMAQKAPSPSRSRSFSYSFASIGLLVLIAGLSYKAFWPAKAVARKIGSVAVLPFVNNDPNSEYIADGMTDGISSALSKVPNLRVANRNSTFHFKNSNNSPATVGQILNVESVVTGSIERRSDDHLITVNLIDVVENSKIWQQQFSIPGGDMLIAQQEIVRAIAKNLNSGDTTDKAKADKPATNSPEAYDLYIQGRYYWNKRTNADILKSTELFQAAIDIDPNFAKAYIALADAYAIGDFRQIGIPSEKRTALAKSYVHKAIDIDNTLGEGYAVLAIGQCYSEWDFAAAEQNYRRAIESSPNDATAHHWYAEFLSMQGRFSESIDEYARASELDPLSLPIQTDMAFMFYYNRQYTQATEILDKAKVTDPNYQRTYGFLSFVLREQGMFAESTDAMDKVYELENLNGAKSTATLDYFKKYTAQLKHAAMTDGAQGFWQAIAKSEITRSSGPYYVAAAYAKLGENDQAFKYLDKAFEQHYTGMVWVKVDPELENLRQDPRYTDLLQRIGF